MEDEQDTSIVMTMPANGKQYFFDDLDRDHPGG
jgi:hypothetical protein